MHSRSSFSLSVLCCLVTSIIATLPIGALAGGVEISEILYAPRSGSEWVEVVNNTGQSVDLTTLSVSVVVGSDRETDTIAAYQRTPSVLTPGAIAVIATDPTAFLATYPYYTGSLFQSSFTLPDTTGSRVEISRGGTVLYQTTYTADPRAQGTGASLHLTENGSIVAPVTPGEVARNPLEAYRVQPNAISSATHTTGGAETADGVFLDTGDIVSLQLFHTERIPQLTADLFIGDQSRQRNFVEGRTGDDVQQLFTYTVKDDDAVGSLSYAVESEEGLVEEGDITHDGKEVFVDTSPPTVSASRVAEGVRVTIEEDHLVQTLRYKVHSAGTCSASGYATIASDEQTVSIPSSSLSVRIDLSNSDQVKDICIVVSDKAGNNTYVTPDQSADGVVAAQGTILARISEISYATSEGITTEWIEVVNDGSSPLDLSLITLVDGDRSRTITHRDGPATVPSGSAAIIAKKPESFAVDFPRYEGPLFRSPMSLLDGGDTLALRVTETGIVLDTVTYSSDDGAKKDGNTLHIHEDIIIAGPPTPGVGTDRPAQQLSPGIGVSAALSSVQGTIPVVRVTHIDGQAVPAGKNLFFTASDSAQATFVVSDDDTTYTRDTIISQYGLDLESHAQNTSLHVSDPLLQNQAGGAVRANYTVAFSRRSDGLVRDNRVVLSPRVEDGSGAQNDPRNDIVLVRNTVAPIIVNGTAASELTFSKEEGAIIPVRVSGIQMGDWLRVTYGGSCDTGLLPFIVRNGGYGIMYRLETGTYENCTVTVTDTAGNTSDVLVLPRIVIR